MLLEIEAINEGSARLAVTVVKHHQILLATQANFNSIECDVSRQADVM